MYPLIRLGGRRLLPLPYGPRYYHQLRQNRGFPKLNLGIRLGWLFSYFKKNLQLMTVQDFVKIRPASVLWGLSRKDVTPPSRPTPDDLLKSATMTIDELEKANKREYSIAAIDENGHLYASIVCAGTLTVDMRKFLPKKDDWSLVTQLPCAFAPTGLHIPPKPAITFPGDLPLYQYGTLELDALVEAERISESEGDQFREKIVETDPFAGRVMLGSNIIERSGFVSAENEIVLLWQYVATTFGFEHVLDGYATHALAVDKRTWKLYFLATGEGKHVWRSIDGVNNPIALFVFSVMARSFFRYLELQASREAAGKPLLDIVRKPAEAQAELRRYIAGKDPELRRDRRRAAVLDYLGRWLPMVRFIFGANVVRAPAEIAFPGAGKPSGGSGGPPSGGSGGPPSGGSAPTDALVPVTGGTPQGGPTTGEQGDGGPDTYSLWPFLLLVSLLNEDDEENDADEDDLDSFFYDTDEPSLLHS